MAAECLCGLECKPKEKDNKMSNREELEAEVARLQAENDKLRAKQPKAPGLTLKVSDKGGVSVYGLGRFPVSLYRSQMERLLAFGPKIQEFIAVNAGKLKTKE